MERRRPRAPAKVNAHALPPLVRPENATAAATNRLRLVAMDAELVRSANHLRVVARHTKTTVKPKPTPHGRSVHAASNNGPSPRSLVPLHRSALLRQPRARLPDNNNDHDGRADDAGSLAEIWRVATTCAKEQSERVSREAAKSHSNNKDHERRERRMAHEALLYDASESTDSLVQGTTLARYRRLVGTHARRALVRMVLEASTHVARHRLEDRCACRIERLVRRFLGRRRRERLRYDLVTAAEALQRWRRVAVARRQVLALQSEAEAMQRASRRRLQAAWTIQRGWRRCAQTRRELREELVQATEMRRRETHASRVVHVTVLKWWQRRQRRTMASEIEETNEATIAETVAPLVAAMDGRGIIQDHVDRYQPRSARDAMTSWATIQHEDRVTPIVAALSRPTASSDDHETRMQLPLDLDPRAQKSLDYGSMARETLDPKPSEQSSDHDTIGGFGSEPAIATPPRMPTAHASTDVLVHVTSRNPETAVETLVQESAESALYLACCAIADNESLPSFSALRRAQRRTTPSAGGVADDQPLAEQTPPDVLNAIKTDAAIVAMTRRRATRVAVHFLLTCCLPRLRDRLSARHTAATRIQQLVRQRLAHEEVAFVRQLHLITLRSEFQAHWRQRNSQWFTAVLGPSEVEAKVDNSRTLHHQGDADDDDDEDPAFDDDEREVAWTAGPAWADVLPTRNGYIPYGLRGDWTRSNGPASGKTPSRGLWQWSWASEQWEPRRDLFALHDVAAPNGTS